MCQVDGAKNYVHSACCFAHFEVYEDSDGVFRLACSDCGKKADGRVVFLKKMRECPCCKGNISKS